MEIFEIHITGTRNIHEIAARYNGHKTIAVELFRKDGSFLRAEHMTSFIMKFDGENNYETCKSQVLSIAEQYRTDGASIWRVKIESPLYKRYEKQSLYMESHFPATDFEHPLSRNQKKLKFLATDRTYDQNEYSIFAETYKDKELELCLYDDNIHEDKDWLNFWNK